MSVRALGISALAVAALAGVIGAGTADAGQPTRALACPGGVQVYDEGNDEARSPRELVRDYLPTSAAYTRANMTGRLDERRTATGATEVVVRGKRHEPIAVYAFVRDGSAWALRYSAQCAVPDGNATLDADPTHRLVCPGLMVGGALHNKPGAPTDHSTPQAVLRKLPLFTGYARDHATGPRETRYLYEGTRAEVFTRDAFRRPIAVHVFAATPQGWQLSQFWACDGAAPFPSA